MLACISEPEMKPLCDKYGVMSVFHENTPLGRKKNFLLQEALKLNFDYLMELNSDDIIKNELVDKYIQLIKNGVDYVTLRNFCYMDSKTGHMNQIDSQTAFAIGKLVKRELVEKAATVVGVRMFKTLLLKTGVVQEGEIYDLRPDIAEKMIRGGNAELVHGETRLWANHLNRGLDNSADNRMRTHGLISYGLRTEEPYAVDIKSDVNIWNFNPTYGVKYPWEDFKKGLSEIEIEKIECLKQV